MQQLIKSERKQATPPGIPIACLVAFCVVLVPTGGAIMPLGLLALYYAVIAIMKASWLALIAVPAPFVILIIAELVYNRRWRSLLFAAGAVALIVEWLAVVRQVKQIPLLMALTSLPFIIFVIIWNARALSALLRFDKSGRSIP